MTQPTNGACAPDKSYGDHLRELLEYVASGLETATDGTVDWNFAKEPPDEWCIRHVRALVMFLAMGYAMQGLDAARIREWAPFAAETLDAAVET